MQWILVAKIQKKFEKYEGENKDFPYFYHLEMMTISI